MTTRSIDLLTGLATMGAVALWRRSGRRCRRRADVFVSRAVPAATVPVGAGVRRVRAELAWRRELRTMPPVDAATVRAAAPVAPTLAELRDSA